MSTKNNLNNPKNLKKYKKFLKKCYKNSKNLKKGSPRSGDCFLLIAFCLLFANCF